MKKYEAIVIHCSASDNRQYGFDRIRHDHINHRGWSDIGYHAGIDHDANIVFLRDINRNGAHTRGHNDKLGICVLGLHNFTPQQFKSLANLCRFFMELHDINAGEIYPHNAFNENKTCPNFDLEQWKLDYLEPELCRWS